MRSAQVSRCPHRFGFVEGAPRDPAHEYGRRGEHERVNRFRLRRLAHLLQPAEVQGSEHVHDDENSKGNRERSMDGTPPPEYLLL